MLSFEEACEEYECVSVDKGPEWEMRGFQIWNEFNQVLMPN